MKKRDFEQFYNQHMERIYRYVFFRVGQNHAVCEDLVSEIFMKALQNFEKYDPEVSKSAWIYRIAHNHLANYYRGQKPQVDIEEVSYSLKGSDGREEFESVESTLKIREGLDALELPDRELVTLKYLEGYSYKEIGEIVGKSADAAKMATHRAMKALREIMN